LELGGQLLGLHQKLLRKVEGHAHDSKMTHPRVLPRPAGLEQVEGGWAGKEPARDEKKARGLRPGSLPICPEVRASPKKVAASRPIFAGSRQEVRALA
jgi:hypothetical protein